MNEYGTHLDCDFFGCRIGWTFDPFYGLLDQQNERKQKQQEDKIMDTALRIMYEIARSILVFTSAILHFTCLMLCTILFAIRKLREACDDYFLMDELPLVNKERVSHAIKRT